MIEYAQYFRKWIVSSFKKEIPRAWYRITKLDRLARYTLHLHKIVNDLNDRGVGFKVLDQSIDTTTKEGRLLFSILASLAEFETELRAERTNEGRIAAMERGVKLGAKPKLTENQIVEMKNEIETKNHNSLHQEF